jgi:hypothetical protein
MTSRLRQPCASSPPSFGPWLSSREQTGRAVCICVCCIFWLLCCCAAAGASAMSSPGQPISTAWLRRRGTGATRRFVCCLTSPPSRVCLLPASPALPPCRHPPPQKVLDRCISAADSQATQSQGGLSSTDASMLLSAFETFGSAEGLALLQRYVCAPCTPLSEQLPRAAFCTGPEGRS